MAGSVFDSALFGDLFPTGEAGRLFSDSAEIRAMLIVEGALARAQGQRGIIPEISAEFIARSVMEVQIDAPALRGATGRNGVCVPGLVEALRKAMEAPEHAQYVHWGATSQDIIDTALMLRLRQALVLVEANLRDLAGTLGDLADAHAQLPMPARTYGQHATPTSFGAVVASWGAPVLELLDELADLREKNLLVSLSGAAGTGSAMGEHGSALRAELAAGLDLGDPGRSWHVDRAPILRIADWFVRVTLALGKMGEDLTELVQTGINEISLGGAGSSSTMPQKQNPVVPSVLVALARNGAGLLSVLHGAATPRHQRDGASWFTEWMVLPQIVLGAASAATSARDLSRRIAPNAEAMMTALTSGLDLIHAETLSFALAAHMSRPDAQALVKSLCREASDRGVPLRDLVARDHAGLDPDILFDPARQMGHAPSEARGFAERARQAAAG